MKMDLNLALKTKRPVAIIKYNKQQPIALSKSGVDAKKKEQLYKLLFFLWTYY